MHQSPPHHLPSNAKKESRGVVKDGILVMTIIMLVAKV